MRERRRGPTDDPIRPARQAVAAGRFREALRLLARLSDEVSSSPESLLLTAMASWRLGNFRASYRSAKQALSGFRSRGDADGEMRAHNVAAAGAFATGELDVARNGFERALRLAQRFHDPLMMARCANNIGNVAYYRGDLAEALRQYGRAASLFDQVASTRGVAEAWHNIGVVRREEGDYDAAGEAADRAIEAAEQLGDLRILGWTIGGRGEVDALQGDLRLGRARTMRARELARGQEDRLTDIDCTRVLSRIALAEGNLDQSHELARTAVELAAELGNPWMLAKSQQQLATVLAARRARDKAIDAFTAAAAAFEWAGAEGRADNMRLLATRLS